MAQRYKVVRRWIKHKGVIYREGDLLPEDFTHHDRFRTVYPSRIGLVEVPDDEITLTDPTIPPEEPKPPLAEESKADTSDEAKGSENPEPPASEEEGSEDKPEEPSSTDEEKKDKDPEAINDKVEESPVAIQPLKAKAKAKPITSVRGKAPTGSKPARPLSNKSTGTSTKA